MNETRTLARFVAETTFRRPASGASWRTSSSPCSTRSPPRSSAPVQPWARRILEVFRDLRGAPEADGSPPRTGAPTPDAPRFATACSSAPSSAEPLTGSHASGTVLPAALAVCERERLSGDAFLAALAVGFEVSARLARAATGLETARAFHNPGAQGPFAAAAAVGKLHGLDEDRLSEFTRSASPAPSRGRAARVRVERRRHEAPAPGARQPNSGSRAALPRAKWRARAGDRHRGPVRLLRRVLDRGAARTRWLDGLGTRWTIRPPWLKSYATHVTHQAVVAVAPGVQAGSRARSARDHARGDPRGARGSWRSATRSARRTTYSGGQYSLPFTDRGRAHPRHVGTRSCTTKTAVRDELVGGELARRIELVPVADAGPHEAPGVWSSEILLE